MKVCDCGHSEVCYAVAHCPVCEVQGYLEERDTQIATLLEAIDNLEALLEEAEARESEAAK